ncbi:exosortase/archaeosortase family protein [Ferruginibacter albus]|uniref:exosortase/archaeosortase family protein n=1 Tax=Ferruginibacter albus TaxID=2875540 RepID=UPI001CC7CF0C|nr:exosortase/archaeosortase family protein [Ferruginibacter albus]
MKLSFSKHNIFFILKFLLLFCLFYYGTILVIGLAAPNGHYSEIINRYFNYPLWLRTSLLKGARGLLYIIGYKDVSITDKQVEISRSSVRLVYSCIGYGVMSFWAAFVLANRSSWKRKIFWTLLGLLMIWFVNVLRISFLLLDLYLNNSKFFLKYNHHLLFNIAVYLVIFLLMFLYDRSQRSKKTTLRSPNE